MTAETHRSKSRYRKWSSKDFDKGKNSNLKTILTLREKTHREILTKTWVDLIKTRIIRNKNIETFDNKISLLENSIHNIIISLMKGEIATIIMSNKENTQMRDNMDEIHKEVIRMDPLEKQTRDIIPLSIITITKKDSSKEVSHNSSLKNLGEQLSKIICQIMEID